MLKFNEDAIKKDVEETLALRKDVEAAVKKICEKGYNNIFLVGIGGTYAVAEELMSYLKGHSKIEIYLENAADLTAEGNTKLGEKSVMVITSATGNTPEMTDAVARKKELRFLDLWMKKILLWQKKLKFCFHAKVELI